MSSFDKKLFTFKNIHSLLSPSSLLLLIGLWCIMSSSVQSVGRGSTWSGACFQNDSFDVSDFSEGNGVPNNLLQWYAQNNGENIFSSLSLTIDNEHGMYNNLIKFCPWSMEMPLKLRLNESIPSDSTRKVCYSVKIGPNQILSSIEIDDTDLSKTAKNNQIRQENLEEVVEEYKEFNLGNCLAKTNSFLFANWDSMLYTTVEFKYFDAQSGAKINLLTPQNFYFVREHSIGTVRDVIDDNLATFRDSKNFQDVIIFKMLRSLNIMHKLGWAHRDVKPESFYVTRTVDHSVKVRLGEFSQSTMHTKFPKNKSVNLSNEDHVFGSPSYVPKDAFSGHSAQTNDLYGIAKSILELIGHTDFESLLSPQNMDNLSQRSVTPLEKMTLALEEEAFEKKETLKNTSGMSFNKSNTIPVSMTQSLPREHISLEDLDNIPLNISAQNHEIVESINLGHSVTIAAKLQDSFSPELSLDLNFDTNPYGNSIKRRILTQNNYGGNSMEVDEMSSSLKSFQKDSQYEGMFNNFSNGTNEALILNVSQSIPDRDVIKNETHELSLPSVNFDDVLNVSSNSKSKRSVNKSLSQVIDLNIVTQVDAEFKESIANTSLFASENKPLSKGTLKYSIVNGNSDVSAHSILVSTLKNMISENPQDRHINSSSAANSNAYKLCNNHWKNFSKKIPQNPNDASLIKSMNSQANQTVDSDILSKMDEDLQDLECLMIIVAMAVDQRKDGANYFRQLVIQQEPVENINDIMKVILADRQKLVENVNPIDFRKFLQEKRSRKNLLL